MAETQPNSDATGSTNASPSSSTTTTTKSTQNINPTLGFYLESLLTVIGASVGNNLAVMAAWSSCEGPAASQGAYNPLNTTYPGTSAGKNGPATVTTKSGQTINIQGPLGGNPNQNGGDPVKNYADFTSGILATVATLAGTPGIVSALKANDGSNAGNLKVADAIGAAKWGTNPSCIASTAQNYTSNSGALDTALQQTVANNKNFQAGNTGALGQNFVTGALGDIGSAVEGAGPVNPLSGLESIASWLTSRDNWIRIGFVALGVVMFLIGIPFILGGTKVGKVAEAL